MHPTQRRVFLRASAALSATAVLPLSVSAQPREAMVFCTPFGFIADFIEIMNAHTGGHFAAQGLDSKVVGAQGTAPAIQQLTAGQAQFIRAASIDFMRAIAQQKLPLLAISTIYQGSTFYVISPEEKPIRNAEDMRGKTIGIVSVGGTTDLFIDLMLTKVNVPRTEVKKEVVGNNPGALALVRQGRIDAFIASTGVVTALQTAKEKIVGWSTDRYAPMPSQCYVTTREVAEKRPEFVVKFLRAMKASVDQVIAGPIGPLIARASKDFDIPGRRNLDALTANMEAAKKLYFSQGKDNLMRNVPSLWREGAGVLAQAGLGDVTKAVDTLYTNQFVDRALKRA
jgi:ABC-type nitrate/sulfonate/bicarbonate transport system substrate-binding protein